jgi:tetratricopeptide (TPR) repeat protein
VRVVSSGFAYLHLGSDGQAIEDYDRAIEINPKDTEAYYNHGYAHSRLGNNEQAIEDWKTAAGLGSKNAQPC